MIGTRSAYAAMTHNQSLHLYYNTCWSITWYSSLGNIPIIVQKMGCVMYHCLPLLHKHPLAPTIFQDLLWPFYIHFHFEEMIFTLVQIRIELDS